MRRAVIAVLATVGLLLTGNQALAQPAEVVVAAIGADRAPTTPTVQVTGEVATTATYSAADLTALPQTTLPLAGPKGGTVTGTSLLDVVQRSGPVATALKNPLLRVAITVTGNRGRQITVAFGELDSGFGNHPALLTVATDRRGRPSSIDLVIPGDQTRLRSVPGVRTVTVTVSGAGPAAPLAGSVQVSTCHRTVTLSAQTLARLPQHTQSVSFLAAGIPQQHTETGPSLAAVLLAARVLPLPNTVVTAVGTDNYGAGVTIGEALFGGRPLLLSLAEDGASLTQPRLVPAGDVKGGRYVSDVVVLSVVGRDCR